MVNAVNFRSSTANVSPPGGTASSPDVTRLQISNAVSICTCRMRLFWAHMRKGLAGITLRGLDLAGGRRLEPPTRTMSGWCSNQPSHFPPRLTPDGGSVVPGADLIIGRGGAGIELHHQLVQRVFVCRPDQQPLRRGFQLHGLPRLHVQRLADLFRNHQADAISKVPADGFHEKVPMVLLCQTIGKTER